MQEYNGAKAKFYPLVKHSAGGGFGPVASPGVGVSYFIEDTRIHVFVTAFGAPAVPTHAAGTPAAVMAEYIGSALRDMAALF